jgi:hypothetical protein
MRQLLVLLLLAVAWPSTALEQPAALRGWFVEVDAVRQSIEGDFKGDSVLVGPDKEFLIPDLDPAFGFAMKVGGRTRELSLSVGYSRSTHDATTFASAKGEATWAAVELELRGFLLRGRVIEPYLQLGWVPWSSLRVKGAAEIISTGELSDAIYVNNIWNWSVGAGANVHLLSGLSTTGTLVYRAHDYRAVKSSADHTPLHSDPPLNGSALGFELGVAYRF